MHFRLEIVGKKQIREGGAGSPGAAESRNVTTI
jgi:hypothetical protein